jgi:hypothetical protein
MSIFLFLPCSIPFSIPNCAQDAAPNVNSSIIPVANFIPNWASLEDLRLFTAIKKGVY